MSSPTGSESRINALISFAADALRIARLRTSWRRPRSLTPARRRARLPPPRSTRGMAGRPWRGRMRLLQMAGETLETAQHEINDLASAMRAGHRDQATD
jgi:hypothetical protein